MHQNIKNKHYRRLDSKLYNEKYYDFMLYKGETICDCNSNLNDMVIADFSDFTLENGKLYSPIQWSGSTNSGIVLKDIGMTGVDNGFIVFDKDKISNREFLKLFFKSIYKINSGDTRLFLIPVTGNTQQYTYNSQIIASGNTNYLALNGGFYQGFFKLFGYDYQVLPDSLNQDITLHFEIRPRSDYEIDENSVNNLHPENSGIFFFMGTRAENKFWQMYSGHYPEINEATEWPQSGSDETNDYFFDDYYDSPTDECENFYDNSINNESYSGCNSCCTYINDTEFIGNDYDVNPLDGQINYIINGTDNKFIFFDRTKTGYTVDNWIEGTMIRIKGKKRKNINYFPWMNRTKTGYTVYDVDYLQDNIELLEGKTQEEIETNKELEILNDIKNNVFALRVTPDGAIGYRYGVLDCSNEEHYSVLEEYSKPGIVKMDEWNSINVRFSVINPSHSKCDKRQRKMRIMIYVNGFLKFISKEVNTLSFRQLNEIYQKQEGVPYNISLGGGTIGLLETIMPRYYDVSKYVFPIEKDFCGTFIGDIKSFKMYLGFIDYCAIKNYLS